MRLRRSIGGFDRPRPTTRRAVRGVGRVLSFALAVLIAAAGLSVLRLSQGPIVLDATVPRLLALVQAGIDESAAGQNGGFRISAGGAHLGLGSRGSPAPGLYVTDVRLQDAAGRSVAVIPEVRIGFRPLDLLAGQLRLTAIGINGASLDLVVDPAVGLVGDIEPSNAPEATPGLAAVLGALLDDPPPLLAHWRSLAFEDLDAAVRLAPGAAPVVTRGASLRLVRRRDVLEARGVLPLPGIAQPLQLAGSIGHSGAITGEVALAGVRLDDLAPLHPLAASLAPLDIPVDASARFGLSPLGALTAASVSARLGSGVVPVGPGGQGIVLHGARFAADLDPVRPRRVTLRAASLDTSSGGVELSGEIDLAGPLADGADGLVATLVLGPTRLPLDDPRTTTRPPLAAFERGRLVARVGIAPWRVEVAEAWLERGDLSLSAAGQIEQAGAGDAADWRVELDGRLKAVTVTDLKALWPPAVAPGAIRWIREHLDDGLVEEASFHVRGSAADPRAEMVFAFRDASATPLPPLPPITGGRGWGRVAPDGFSLALDTGRVTLPGEDGGVIDLAGSTFSLDDFEDERAPARIAVRGRGPIPAILTLIGREPLALTERLAIAPGDTAGLADVRVELGVPLLRDLPVEDVAVTAEATLTNVRLSVPDLDMPLAADRLALRADTTALRLTGEATLGRSGFAVAWDEVFSPEGDAARTVVAAEGQLQPADAAVLGLPVDGPTVTVVRPLPVTLRLVRGARGLAEGATRVEAEAGLAGVALAVPALGWRKAVGAAGTLRLAAVADGGTLAVERIAAETAGLRLVGRGRLDGGGIERLDIDTFRLGTGTALSGRVERRGDGYVATLRGASLDARPLIDTDDAPTGGARPDIPIDLRFEIERLLLAEDVVVTAARGSLLRRDDGAVVASLDGRIGSATLSAALDRDAAGSGRLRLRSGDAGALLRGAGLFPRALGGRLDLTAALSSGQAIGEVRVEEVIVSNDPTLDGLLRGADLAAALERLRAEGIRFDTVRVPFLWRESLLTVTEAVAVGPVIGLTLSGDYDLQRDALAMEGVFTPLYGLNSLIGNVPLLGPLLTGGEGQGLIAFTFRLTGPAADARTSVNPLSALLPGMLRTILRPGGGVPPVYEDNIHPDQRSGN